MLIDNQLFYFDPELLHILRNIKGHFSHSMFLLLLLPLALCCLVNYALIGSLSNLFSHGQLPFSLKIKLLCQPNHLSKDMIPMNFWPLRLSRSFKSLLTSSSCLMI
uniref:Similar to PIE1 (PHOTOPERIOD-INDEPENDENT EARLY FLOWERING 1) n=1 Tax=Arundo donax TaxID=35708 RepID=A0A0A9CBG3_ARUDO